MRKRFFLMLGVPVLGLGALALILSARAQNAAPADAAPKAAGSRIVQVTIYPNSALVTREVDVPAVAGHCELVVTPLPEHTINSSLYSEGSDGIRVLSTRFRMRPVKEDTREEVRKIEDEIRKLQMTQQKIQADIAACQMNMQLLGKMENFTTTGTAGAAEKGKLDSESAIALAKYLMEGRNERSRELVTLQQQLQTNTEQMQFVQRQLRDLTAGSSKTERDAVIVVEKPNGAAGKVRLNYLVDAASWRPQYKLRSGKETKDPIQLEYLAAVVQQTGEDWTGVKVVLSTAQPMLNAAPPDLQMLALNVAPLGRPGEQTANIPPGSIANPEGRQTIKDLDDKARELRGKAQGEFNSRMGGMGNKSWNDAGAYEQARDLVLSMTEKDGRLGRHGRSGNNEGPSVTYHLETKLTVPSRNDEQVIEVARLDLTPDYYYKAVPVLTRHVYRLANLTNSSKYVLLPGEATMYTGSDFVGRMDLPLVAIGETFTAGFGVDPQLQVQRVLLDKQRTMQGGNQVLKFEYRILVSSYKPEKVKLQVWDRLPHAEGEAVGVTLVKSSQEVSKDALYQREERPNNLLRWDVEVDPTMTGEKAFALTYDFKLELDKNMTIGTFMTR